MAVVAMGGRGAWLRDLPALNDMKSNYSSSSIGARPRLRPDLVFSTRPSRDGGVVVKDPLRRKYFRLGPCELFIARQLDGETAMDEVRRRAEAQFGAVMSSSALEAFTGALHSAGLLDDGSTPAAPRRKPLVHGSLLRIQVRAFDPDRLLEAVLPSVRWCFSRAFVVAALLAVGAALLVALSTWGAMAAEGAALLKVASIPVFVVAIFALLSAHEMAHGLTCKHFGGAVHEMGFMLIYFQPAFYCDVSDAWLIPDRWKRVCVSAAGPLLELTLWACATLVWIATDGEATIHRLALVVMLCTGAHTLLNFNPFIKLDGYYILSDLVAIPNLRRRAFAYVGSRIKRLIGLETPDDPAIPRRERLIFLAYGVVASAGTFALLATIIGTFGASLLDGRQPLLLGLVLTLVGVRFRRRFRRLFGGAANLNDDEDDGGIVQPTSANVVMESAVPQLPAHTQSTAVPQLPAQTQSTALTTHDPDAERAMARRERRRARQRRRRAAWIAAAIAVVAFVVLGRWELKVPGPITVLPEHNADVRTGIEGIIDRIHVNEGDTVRAGDTIATLSARETRAQLKAVEADIARSSSACSRSSSRGSLSPCSSSHETRSPCRNRGNAYRPVQYVARVARVQDSGETWW
jgi:biotin carboxyl carrier protein